jgi:hypothetical protein
MENSRKLNSYVALGGIPLAEAAIFDRSLEDDKTSQPRRYGVETPVLSANASRRKSIRRACLELGCALPQQLSGILPPPRLTLGLL